MVIISLVDTGVGAATGNNHGKAFILAEVVSVGAEDFAMNGAATSPIDDMSTDHYATEKDERIASAAATVMVDSAAWITATAALAVAAAAAAEGAATVATAMAVMKAATLLCQWVCVAGKGMKSTGQ